MSETDAECSGSRLGSADDYILNINQYVRFKLKPRGVEIVKAYFETLNLDPYEYFPDLTPGSVCHQQFHAVIRILGGENMRCDADGSAFYDVVVEPMPSP